MKENGALSDYLSLISVTHYSPKKTYGKLAPPSTGIIKETIKSFRDGILGLDKCDHHVIYNKPINSVDSSAAELYHENLKELSDELDFMLHTHPNQGLGPALIHGLKYIDTPLVLFVEHDWELIEEVNIDGIIKCFKTNDEINSIRFNKRENTPASWDTIVKEDQTNPITLCKVSTVGNHPQITRTSIFFDWVKSSKPTLSTVLKGFWYHYSSPVNLSNFARSIYEKYVLDSNIVRNFDDVEFILDTKYKSDIRNQGFSNAHRNWGTYLYGSKNSGPYVRHLGR